jgi:NAD(P)-dependent dehydrogenase (short-subunit alcohol dehydrogenase family)
MTERNVLITGADRGLGLALSQQLLQTGWQVFAGQHQPGWLQLDELKRTFPQSLHITPLDVAVTESAYTAAKSISQLTNSLDMLINNAGVNTSTYLRSIREPQDYDEIHRLYDVNALGPLRIVEAFLPLLDQGTLKRLCFVSSEAGSIARTERTSWYGYTMSKAALNMAVHILFNDLRVEGYTFRLYHPGWIKSYMRGVKSEEGDLEPEEAAVPALAYFLDAQIDEDLLVMRDWQGKEWPW